MKTKLLNQSRLSQLLFSVVLGLLFANTSWGQTTVFYETFGTATNTNYTGGTSTIPTGPSASYAIATTTGSAAGTVILSQVALNTANGYLNMFVNNSSSNAKGYISTAFPSGLNANLTSNTGKITWTFNLRMSSSSAGANGYANNSRFGGVILCSSNADMFASTSASTGYAVIMSKNIDASATNTIKLVRMTQGFNSTATNTNNPTLIASTSAQLGAYNNYESIKVIYDPNADTFELYVRNDGATAWTDAGTDTLPYTLVGSVTESSYVNTPMYYHGYMSSNTATSTGLQYDNYKVVLSPPPTAPQISFAPAFTAFGYEGSGPSASQSTVVTGANLGGSITINTALLTKYQVSLDDFTTAPATGTLTITSGATLYVRLKAGLAAGTQNETIVLNSTADSYTKNLNCVGTVIGAYTYNGSGSLSDINNWTPPPSAMEEAAAKFYITSNATTDFVWVLGASSIASVKDGATLTIADTFPITGQVNVLAASTLKVQADVYPTFGTIDATSNVHLQKQPAGNFSQNATFGNLFIDGGSSNAITFGSGTSGSTISGALTVNGTLTVAEDTDFSGNSSVYNCFYINSGGKAIINGKYKHSRAINLVSFGAARSTVTGAPGIQFADAENVGVNYILGTNSTIEFSRGNSGTKQEITPRSDYANLTISDGSNGANSKNVSSPINISGTLTINHLSTGSILNTGTGEFVLGNNASIVRTSGSFGTVVPITFGSSVNVLYDGTTAISSGAEIPTATSVLNNLEINNAGGVTLTSATAVNNTLTLTAGNLATGDLLTLKSTASNTARVAPVTGTISGNVTVERYIPARRAWKALTAPLKGSTTSLYAAWQNGGTTIADTGVEIWGPAGTSMATGPSYSALSYTPTGWANVTNTSTSNLFDATKNNAYLIFVTGAYANGSGNISSGATATTLKATGELITGDVNYTGLINTKHTLIGNPYASPLDPTKILTGSTNLENYYWVWDPTLGTLGGYVSYDNLMGEYSNTAGSYTNTTAIQSGQAFFVIATASSTGTLALTESTKSTAVSNVFGKSASSLNASIFRVGFYKEANQEWKPLDGAIVGFYDTANSLVDSSDGKKFNNGSENIAFVRDNITLSSEHFAIPQPQDELFIRVWNTAINSYKLRINTEQFTVPNLDATLLDLFTGTQTAIPLNGTVLEYPFAVTSDALSTGNRFKVVFSTSALAIKNIKNNDIKVYPNPATNGIVNVLLPKGDYTNYTYQLVNVLGQIVMSDTIETVTENQFSISTKGLADNLYALQILNAGKTVYQTKVIIKN